MKVVTTIEELRSARRELRAPVGLVPTMGFLHAGHLSLAQAARQENAGVIVSIFVNPTQFGPQEDLDAYPRDLKRDLRLLEAEGVDLVWTPTTEEMYPADFQTEVHVKNVTQPLEGAYRPGHFVGVATVVAKIFNAAQPDRAYFGQKDAQQVVVIQQMTRDLHFPIEIVVRPIVREADGLAMSSRNTYLNPQERAAAVVLYQALQKARAAFEAGERDAGRLREVMAYVIEAEPLAHRQYVSVADSANLQEIDGQITRPALASMAVYIGKTRLIDNQL
ncbi:MAG TPA: pantoate--beta-alanine ligase, partial [Anaerolineales bacterium]|nr:pantoate--beta-alanine ligase [Anaerolineales bacterium]